MAKPPRFLRIKGKRYYRYNIYRTNNEARKIAKYYREKNNTRYFIQAYEDGYFIPETKYALYLNNIISFV